MCFATTYNMDCLPELEKFIWENIPWDLYTRGCWLISRIVHTITGAPVRCIGIYCARRGGCIPHWINLNHRSNGIIDLKRRCFKKTANMKPIIPGWVEDVHYIPEGRPYYNVKNGVFDDKEMDWVDSEQRNHYTRFIEEDNLEGFTTSGWKKHHDRVVNKWFNEKDC